MTPSISHHHLRPRHNVPPGHLIKHPPCQPRTVAFPIGINNGIVGNNIEANAARNCSALNLPEQAEAAQLRVGIGDAHHREPVHGDL